MRRTKEEALATRNRLLDAAEVLFQAQGVSNTSLQQIAEEAGATRGAIYWHFKDKADLFNAMMERVTLPMEAAHRAAAEVLQEPLAVLKASLIDALHLTATDPQVRRVFEVASHKVEYSGEMQSVQQRRLAALRQCWDDFETTLRHAARREGVKLAVPAATAARGLHALVAGLIQDWLLAPDTFDLVKVGGRLFDMYLLGLGFGNGKGRQGEG